MEKNTLQGMRNRVQCYKEVNDKLEGENEMVSRLGGHSKRGNITNLSTFGEKNTWKPSIVEASQNIYTYEMNLNGDSK